MIIASNLQTWIQSFYSLRLSQILDMYYSYEGIAFNMNVRACDRSSAEFSSGCTKDYPGGTGLLLYKRRDNDYTILIYQHFL